MTGQHRSTQRYQPQKADDEEALLKAIHQKVGAHPRYGCRRITQLLKETGWKVNYKRIHRLWKQEGLRVPQKKRKRRYIGKGANACDKRFSVKMNDVWTLDFIYDRLISGRQIRCLAIVDEYTRENLCLKLGHSISGEDVITELNELIKKRGIPTCIRSDNGPEFISKKVKEWLEAVKIEPLFVEPGAPWQNGYIEGFNSRFRDEFLNMEHFSTVREAQQLALKWQKEYNEKRPHSSLNYQTPNQFAKSLGGTS